MLCIALHSPSLLHMDTQLPNTGSIGKPRSTLAFIIIALAVYAAWVASTYILEGRINLLQTVDPVGRITYVAIGNIAIGTVFSALAIRYLIRSNFVRPRQVGLSKSKSRTAIVLGAATVGIFALFAVQNPRTLEPIVVFNVFMQALPVSTAEVMVCWALIGSSFESQSRKRGRVTSIVVGAIIASVLFGVYHYAHSPPFNQTRVVLFLMLPSIATAIIYFVGRDIYAAIIVQNFMGIVGVMANLPNLEVYRQPMIAIYALSAVSVAALIISVSIVLRKSVIEVSIGTDREERGRTYRTTA